MKTNACSALQLEHEQNEAAFSAAAIAKNAGGWKSVKYIIGNESFEKLASMSLISNITLYLLTKYNMSSVAVVNVVQIWNGCSNLASLAGAFISDTYLGRFRTLFFGTISSLLGILTMTLTAGIHQLRPPACKEISHCQKPRGWQLGVLFASLAFLSIGAGGIRPCNIAFGADQFDSRTEKGRSQLASFFNWWYFSFTIALVISLVGVVYIQTNISWTLGFAIPTACLALSIVIFLLGRHTYVIKKPQGSIFTDMAKVIAAACRKRKLKVSGKPFYDPALDEQEMEKQRLQHTDRFKCLDKAALIADPGELDSEGIPKNGWRLCSLQQVEHFKCLVGILPVWVTGICGFVVMDQQGTFGVLQVVQTDRSIGPHFKVPPGWLHLMSMIALAVWIFIYECIFIPLSKIFAKRAIRLTLGLRIRIGILLSILCMLVAAVVEKKRRDSALRNGSFISPMSFGYLLPQYVLSGLNEAFAAVSIMEFFTTQMPEEMRTIAGAVFFVSMSISNYIGSFTVNMVHKATTRNGRKPWLGGHDLNMRRLDNFYYLIAGLGALNFLYFHFFASHHLNSSSKKEQERNSVACTEGVSPESTV